MRAGVLAAGLGMLASAPALAADKTPCAAGLICASNPPSVGGAVMTAGYKSLIDKDGRGDPMIDSAAAGYSFTIYFYGCEEHKACDSLQFQASFKADPAHTEAFANRWNAGKRFTQMSVNAKGEMTLSYDVSTTGGLTRENFADVMDWWTTMLGQLGRFYDEKPGPSAATAPAPRS